MSQDAFQQIAIKLNKLLERYGALKAENRRLKRAEQQWLAERSRLLEKNQLARKQIESTIDRLKQLEQEEP